MNINYTITTIINVIQNTLPSKDITFPIYATWLIFICPAASTSIL